MDMHGALHVDGYDDAQATLIKEIRDIVGDKVLIGAALICTAIYPTNL